MGCSNSSIFPLFSELHSRSAFWITLLSSGLSNQEPSVIEPGLQLYEEEGITGVEFPAGGGRSIDILAVDDKKRLVVIELKVARGYDRAVGQLLRYMAWIEKVLAHVRGEVDLPCRIVDDPAAEHILAIRKRMKLSRQKFADRFGLDARAVKDWEQGRRVPDRAACVLLTVIDRDPEAVVRVLSDRLA